jgi:pimeloyl-ACP methyl ester carboxylesterase
VLCGHSYGGMVITGVAEKVPEKIRSLVYLDAFVPANGQMLMDFLTPEMRSGTRDDAKESGEGYLISPIPAEVLNVNEKDATWVDRMNVKHPLTCFEQEILLTDALAQVRKRTFVLTTDWGASLSPFVAIAERLDLELDMPKETAEILIAASCNVSELLSGLSALLAM